MTDDEPIPLPDDDSSSPTDPFEAELVAYLDGELDPVAARKVEARLASDPVARAKAAELKKTFDLLDYLPRPEPSPTFTTRTLDRLPAVNVAGSSAPQPAPAARTQTQSPAAAVVPPTATSPALSSSGPVPLSALAVAMLPPATGGWGFWAGAILVAVTACGAIGYFASSLLHLRHSVQNPATTTPEELPISDYRAIENLPLYAAADDIDFVHELAGSDYFGDDPAVAYDLKVPPVDPDKPSSPTVEKLTQSFKALSSARQQAIRELDKQLYSQPVALREHLFRVLEVYTIWLDRLPEAQRKVVLAATTPKKRLEEVKTIRNEQWVDALPPVLRAKLAGLPPKEKTDLIKQWKDEEATRRDEWGFVRKHADDIAANRIPWPFDDLARRKEVIEFMRTAYHLDDTRKCRFSEYDLKRYPATLDLANEKNGWGPWSAYGKLVYEVTVPPAQMRKSEFAKYELLPEWATGESITRVEQLPKQTERFFTQGAGAKSVQDKIGKWPDFALTVHGFSQFPKVGLLPPLGPSRPGDFKEPLKTFVTKELMPVLGMAVQELKAVEGRWPEYPREMLKLSRQHNLSVPGMMLPGSPRQWDATYGPSFRPGPPRP